MGILTNISLFSGVGGLDLSAKWTGKIKTVAYCEYDTYAQAVLMSRIRDGGLDDAPIWDDVSTFPAEQFKGIDIVSGGFPCQDVSVAGKRAGVERGNRTGLFYELIRICREVGPRFILLENVRGLLIYPGAHRVFGELADLGYDAGWKVISASDVGAPHQRKRVWIVAYSRRNGCKPKGTCGERFEDVADTAGKGLERIERAQPKGRGGRSPSCGKKLANTYGERLEGERPVGNKKRREGARRLPGLCSGAEATPFNVANPGLLRQEIRKEQATGVKQQGESDRGWWAVEPGIC